MVAEKAVLSLESLSSLGFEGRNLGCPGILPGCPRPLVVFKKFVPKKFALIVQPYARALPLSRHIVLIGRWRRQDNHGSVNARLTNVRDQLTSPVTGVNPDAATLS